MTDEAALDRGPTQVRDAIERWQRKLLDLAKRNRALNFKVSKVSTITVVDEQPSEVFRHLVLQDRPMKFKAAAPRLQAERSNNSDDESADSELYDDSEPDATAPDFAPYDRSALADRYTDDYLQTNKGPEALDRSLRRLDDQARLTLEEQGVNTMFLALGMLHYREAPASEETFRAPLVLVPVVLERSSARSGYTVRAGDEDPIINPALAEYVRLNFGLGLPDLPDPAILSEEYDLQELFSAVSAAVLAQNGWHVKTDIYLAPFAFQKLVMYKDLERNAEAVASHPLIQQLVARSGEFDGPAGLGLPTDVRDLVLDSAFPPERTAQIVDADSSQLRTIAAVSRGHHLVIEGPPGTGKSQTITNLIAQALSEGKSVLFVAEKMAALQVVYDRLSRAGLGEFCLSLHSTNANKREVLRDLASAMDASMDRVAPRTDAAERLPAVRHTLNEYVGAVHTPYGALGITPFQGYGELARVYNSPRVRFTRPVEDMKRHDVDVAVRALDDVAVAAAGLGSPVTHPWRDARKIYYSEDDIENVRRLAGDIAQRMDTIAERASSLHASLGLPEPQTLADVDVASAVGAVLRRAPGAPFEVLTSTSWNQPPAEAVQLIERGRLVQKLAAQVSRKFTRDVLERDHAEEVVHVRHKARGAFAFLAILDARYRSIRSEWLRYRLAGSRGSLLSQAKDMEDVDRLRNERISLSTAKQFGSDLFGTHWNGEHSNWDELEAYVAWVVEYRRVCLQHAININAVSEATRATPDTSAIESLTEAAAAARGPLDELTGAIGWPDAYLNGIPIKGIAERARDLLGGLDLAPQWASFASAMHSAQESAGSEVVGEALGGTLAFPDVRNAFLRAFYAKWLAEVVRQRPALQEFHSLAFEQRIAEFRELDKKVLQENRVALIGQLRKQTQESLRDPGAANGIRFLRQQMARQRGHAALRTTMKFAGPTVRAIKPCFMMSPLTVAQFVASSSPTFDLVIFDEASQVPPEDAIGAIVRGRQLVVVGDPKQLPPTDFFSVASGMVTPELDPDGMPIYDDAESILEQYMGAGVPMSRLKWHYRSAHESLIAYSNVEFYDSELYIFPSVERGTDNLGLQFEYVKDGTYEGKGLNAVEARRVADAVAAFAVDELARREQGAHPRSLGVGTFNMRQMLAVQDELELRRRADPAIEPFFDRALDEPFFVKNLENIQGDERDVIFISVTYAKALDGRLRYNFGPLNGENGWRRLNVLTTRARQRMRVFSSIRGDEINLAGTQSRGAKLLRGFLLYAERGILRSDSASANADTESPFEAAVLRELTDHGYQVQPQVGTAGYRVDLGVIDPELPGRYICGVECDGFTYHSSETARDRDRLRQQVLEDRGWTIHRVWSTDWFKDRKGQVERLLTLISRTKQAQHVAAQHAATQGNRAREPHPGQRMQSGETSDAPTEPHRPPADRIHPRPSAKPYLVTPGEGQYAGQDLLASWRELVPAVIRVVEVESPIHETDLLTRVAGMWGQRAGSRIVAHIRRAADSAQDSGAIHRAGAFYWHPRAHCVVRSRAGTGIPGNRVPPEEYELAVAMVLNGGAGMPRTQLIAEVRSVFGFNRTGHLLEETIGAVINQMSAAGKLGEGSTGLRLRS